jgi:D-alanyl-D-alanine endopeptidase (penicillin-binding protein 7)
MNKTGRGTGIFRKKSLTSLGAALIAAGFAFTSFAAPAADAAKTSAAKPAATSKSKHKAKHRRHGKHARVYYREPPSVGHTMGLQAEVDLLKLKSSAALVLDQESNEVLFEKNPHAVLPIASLTKLMTAMVVLDANQPMDEILDISVADSDYEKHVTSRLRPGTKLTREDMLLLALMASENRAASSLGRHFPGGLPAFIDAMNAKALSLGMKDTHYVDPNGLSHENVSSAADLARLVAAAYDNPTIREFSTQTEYTVKVGRRKMEFHSTNALVRRPHDWQIGLQKTGFTNEAGRCLVMQAAVQGRNVVMVFLDSAGKLTRFADANRVRHWIENTTFPEKITPTATPVRETTVPPENKKVM